MSHAGWSDAFHECCANAFLRAFRSGPVQFVIADVGQALRWIPESECFHFWKNEVNPHLAADAKTHLDDYAGEYFYRASEWKSRKSEAPIVVLEIYH